MNAKQLRYKMQNLDSLCPNRSVTNDSEDLSEDELIGGIPVIDRIDSIQNKIDQLLTLNRG